MTAVPFGRFDTTKPASQLEQPKQSEQPKNASRDRLRSSSPSGTALDTISPSRLAFFASPVKLTEELPVKSSGETTGAGESGREE